MPKSSYESLSFARQTGAALLILLALIAIATGAFLVNTFGASAQQMDRERRTEAALAQAKEALIQYAASYADTTPGNVPGYLPCPDDGSSSEGTQATTTCAARDVSNLGKLPWKTLGLPALRDGSQECLWYAVSGNYKANFNKTYLMNWDTNGLITVRGPAGDVVALGNTPSGAVAVVFAPGLAIAGQTRADAAPSICGGNYIAANYLDSSGGFNNAVLTGGANVISTVTAAAAVPGAFNDRLIFITARDIFDAIERRQHVDPTNVAGPRLSFSAVLNKIAQRTAECIALYPARNAGFIGNVDRRLPWSTGQPLAANNYGLPANYDDVNGVSRFFGRIPRITDQSRTTTANSMAGPPYAWLAETNCAGWTNVQPWWENWKDHIFYAVSEDFAPDGDDDDTDCGDCVRVIAPGPYPEYAGIVFFAGKRLAAQDRNNNFGSSNSAEKGQIGNYLELENATASTDGRGIYRTGAESSVFNDVLYCINEDLTVIQCP